MLAGLTPKAAAEHLVKAFSSTSNLEAGVKFPGTDGWRVLDRSGFEESNSTSPIQDHEAFIIFDEARCRYELQRSHPSGE